MKIAIVFDQLYPFSIGGTEVRNYLLARELAKLNHEVHLFGCRTWEGNDTIIKEGIHFQGIGKFRGKRRILDPIKYSYRLSKFLQGFDIIDCAAFPYIPAIVSKKTRIPLIITWHQVIDVYWKNFGLPGMVGKIIEKYVSGFPVKHIAVSEYVQRKLISLGVKRKNTMVINNWIDLEKINASDPSDRKYDIIYAGRFMAHKNVNKILRACSILPETKALILGDGPELLKLLRLKQALGLKNCEILAHVPRQQQLFSYMKSCKGFVLLSDLEGFSTTTVEAMACGIPVLTVNSGLNAAKDLVQHGYNGLLTSMEESEIAHRIKQLTKMKVRENCIRFAEQFDIKKQMPRILQVYANATC